MQKLLIIHTAFIGDIILATPLIPAIKKAHPDCLIDFITIPASANLLESVTDINNLFIFDKRKEHKGIKGLKNILRKINENKYDACICPHRSLRSAIIARYSHSKIRVGFDNSSWKRAFTHIVKYDQTLHETQRNLSLLQKIGIQTNQTRPVIKEDKEDRAFVDSLLNDSEIGNNKIFAVAPGSVWATKKWPKEKFIDLIEQIEENGYQVILIGGKNDIGLCREIENQNNRSKSFAGKFSLKQTKYLLTKCVGLVSNDSAPLHLGLAANIPVFAVFGPTIAEFGFAPIEENSYVHENKNLKCRPCGIHGSYKCPTKTFDCMELTETDQIGRRISEHIK